MASVHMSLRKINLHDASVLGTFTTRAAGRAQDRGQDHETHATRRPDRLLSLSLSDLVVLPRAKCAATQLLLEAEQVGKSPDHPAVEAVPGGRRLL